MGSTEVALWCKNIFILLYTGVNFKTVQTGDHACTHTYTYSHATGILCRHLKSQHQILKWYVSLNNNTQSAMVTVPQTKNTQFIMVTLSLTNNTPFVMVRGSLNNH
jgi:hypothetical protein